MLKQPSSYYYFAETPLGHAIQENIINKHHYKPENNSVQQAKTIVTLNNSEQTQITNKQTSKCSMSDNINDSGVGGTSVEFWLASGV